MNLQNSTFLITGGASGLGFATARMLVESGGQVVMADLDAHAGHAGAMALGAAASFVATDVTDEASMSAAVVAAAERGHLRGLVCCAGVAPGERLLGHQGPHGMASFMRVVTINLGGTFNAVRLAADVMRCNSPDDEGQRGVIVCTASIAAFDGQIGQAAYAASKAAVVGMTLPLARELAVHGIRIMTIAPGIFETPMLKDLPVKVQASLGEKVPFPSRLGRPEEYAGLVRAIVDNPMLNGEVIRLDGAIRMASR